MLRRAAATLALLLLPPPPSLVVGYSVMSATCRDRFWPDARGNGAEELEAVGGIAVYAAGPKSLCCFLVVAEFDTTEGPTATIAGYP